MNYSLTNNILAEAQANFALDLLREISHCPMSTANTVLSPISLAITLAMVRAGADGKTAEQLDALLTNGALPEGDLNKYFGELFNATLRYDQAENDNQLKMVNKVYASSLDKRTNFGPTIRNNYGDQSQPEMLNFSQNVAAAKRINRFVEETTNYRVHSVIIPGRLDETISMVLISGIYFKGKFAEKINHTKTQRKTFHVSKEYQKQVEMIRTTSTRFVFHENDEFQLIGMPFEGEKLLLFVLLPKERFGLGKMLIKLDGAELIQLIRFRNNTNNVEEIEVIFPEFRLSSVHDLNEPLKQMGVHSAFGQNAAFPNISSEQSKISQVVQKAIIEFDEGSSYDHSVDGPISGSADRVVRLHFVADHPFAFFVVSDGSPANNNNILLAGIFTGSRW